MNTNMRRYRWSTKASAERETWLYRIFKDGKIFYFRFEVSELVEKADFVASKIKKAIETMGESLVHDFLNQHYEITTWWVLEPRDIRKEKAVGWEEEFRGNKLK